MSDLTIPDESVRAVYASPYADSMTNKGIRSTLELGAPMIVAAELRQIAEQIEDDDPHTADFLRARASELDPEGGAR